MTARTTVITVLFALGLTHVAAASDPPPMKIVPAPASQIEITNATLVPGTVSSECVSFVNHAPQAAKRVVFVFTKLDANGVAFGRDVFDRRGSFDPNGTVEGMRSGRDMFSRSKVANCHDTDMNRRTPDTIRVEITTVELADGTVWQAPLMPTATPSPVPSPTDAPAPEPASSP
jgi:hypothetical protein